MRCHECRTVKSPHIRNLFHKASHTGALRNLAFKNILVNPNLSKVTTSGCSPNRPLFLNRKVLSSCVDASANVRTLQIHNLVPAHKLGAGTIYHFAFARK